jgi:DNA-binding protein YbaB
MRHGVGDVLALVQEQMRDLSVMQQQQAALTATGTAADGLVEVTLDARRTVTATKIDETYLREFEFIELSGYITTAAQAAAQEIERRAAELLAPLTARRQEISSLSGVMAPDFHDLMSSLGSMGGDAPRPDDSGDGDPKDGSSYPVVRS